MAPLNVVQELSYNDVSVHSGIDSKVHTNEIQRRFGEVQRYG